MELPEGWKQLKKLAGDTNLSLVPELMKELAESVEILLETSGVPDHQLTENEDKAIWNAAAVLQKFKEWK